MYYMLSLNITTTLKNIQIYHGIKPLYKNPELKMRSIHGE